MLVAATLFTTMGTADLERAERLVGNILGELLFVKAETEDVAVFQERYARALRKVLREQLDGLEAEGLRGAVGEVVAYAETAFGPETAEKLQPYAERYLRQAMRAGQALRAVPENVRTLWDAPRQGALDWLVEHDRFWIGKAFPSHVRDAFRDVIAEGMREGLGRKDIAQKARALILGKPGVPGKVELYNRVVSTSVARARSWGGTFSLDAAGIESYTWRAVGDERTCPRCSFFNGQTFRTAPAMALVRRALASAPEAIERLAPWPSEDHERDDFYVKTPRGREYIRGKSAAWLQDRGMGMPPLHAGCRCTIIAEAG